MLKMLGAVLIIAAATLAGLYQASQYANRPKQIRRLILALKRLETEVVYGFTPLPEALQRIAGPSKEPIKSLFLEAANNMSPAKGYTAQEGLQHALDAKWKFTSMKLAEKEVLHQLAYTLGTSDRHDQLNHIKAAVSQLESEEIAAREDQVRYEKMFKSLGLLTGALIVIMIY